MPQIVCCGCEKPTALNKPVCDECIAKLVRTRTHMPFDWCCCEPTVAYEDPETGRRVISHNEVH
jgi:predicted amidophosphoribosyltransferase